jgi:hypothetical protein
LDDQILLDLYKKCQRERRSLGVIYPSARRDDSLDRGIYQLIAAPVVELAKEQILAITSTLYRFCYDLHRVTAWSKVFESVTESEKWQALVEFVFPIISLSLSAPYSVKQTFVKSIYLISYETNKFVDSNRNPKHKGRPELKDTEKVAAHFASWPKVLSSLSMLNDSNYTNATDDFRHKFNHGLPRRIEIGETLAIRQNPALLVNVPPLLITDLIPLLAAQYKAALSCYDAYIELIKEQDKLWPR